MDSVSLNNQSQALILLINVKMPIIVGFLTLMKAQLSLALKSFKPPGPEILKRLFGILDMLNVLHNTKCIYYL